MKDIDSISLFHVKQHNRMCVEKVVMNTGRKKKKKKHKKTPQMNLLISAATKVFLRIYSYFIFLISNDWYTLIFEFQLN